MELNQYIDHTILKPAATEQEVQKLIDEAKEYHFKSVCINPTWVRFAAKELKDSDVLVCTVIGFPLGANTSAVKAFETEEAVKNGADEVDMVINIGELKAHHDEAVFNDIKAVVDASGKATVKVIIETCLLTEEEKIRACKLAQKAGADFVKTSTGFSTGGATTEDIALMRQTVGDKMGVKASGGIHSKEEAEAMIEAGATRIGASASIKIVNG